MAEASLLESPEIAAKLALLKQKRKSILAALHKTIENAERKQTAAGPSLDVRAQQPQQQQPQQQQQQQLHPHRSVLNTARSPQQPITGWASDDSDEHAEELPREIRVAGALRIKVCASAFHNLHHVLRRQDPQTMAVN